MDDSEVSLAPGGQVSMMRTDEGIWVDVRVELVVDLTCSRCLVRFTHRSKMTMGEEYFPTVDVSSGRSVPTEAYDEGIFTIDRRHGLDLQGALREYTITNQPMKPLCGEG